MNWTMDASAPTHTTAPDYAAFLQQQLATQPQHFLAHVRGH